MQDGSETNEFLLLVASSGEADSHEYANEDESQDEGDDLYQKQAPHVTQSQDESWATHVELYRVNQAEVCPEVAKHAPSSLSKELKRKIKVGLKKSAPSQPLVVPDSCLTHPPLTSICPDQHRTGNLRIFEQL